MKGTFRYKSMAAVIAAATAFSALTGCGKSGSGVSGTFEGTAPGIAGDSNPVKVTITLKDSKITDVKAEGAGETEGIGTKALEQLPPKMVEGNTIKVDAVSTATITSDAIMAAAAAAIEAAGLNPEDYKVEVSSTNSAEDITKDCDIVIVGAGGAGMTAAIEAADAGKKVIIVESQSVAGGNSVRSTGGMNAAKTTYQDNNEFTDTENTAIEKTLKKAADNYADNAAITELAAKVKQEYEDYKANPEGYFDSTDLFELDTMIGGAGKNDPELVATLCENSADAIDWLSSIGADLHNVALFGGASVKRIHRPVDENGKTIAVGSYVVPILEKNCAEKNVEIIYDTTAEKILVDGDKAVGIEGKGTAGNTVTINAKAVILATGGFGANNDMVVAQNHPELKGYITTNAPGILGQGITMAEECGADTVDMDQIQLHPTVHVDEAGNAALITEGLRGDGAILVNKEGKRFFDETSTRDKVSDAENSQTDGMAWLIVDEQMYEASAVIQGYVKKGYTVEGDDAKALAEAMNVDAAALEETINHYNEMQAAGEDTDFGRVAMDHQLTGKLYALTVQPGIHHTMGGLKIDTAAEVLDKDGNAIPGLFAAGEVTGGVHGANRLGGNAVADFTVFGRIAGQSAVAYTK